MSIIIRNHPRLWLLVLSISIVMLGAVLSIMEPLGEAGISANNRHGTHLSKECNCCGQTSGRFCGSTLNVRCTSNHLNHHPLCVENAIYYCVTGTNQTEKVRYCPGATFGYIGCLQVNSGSARCAN